VEEPAGRDGLLPVVPVPATVAITSGTTRWYAMKTTTVRRTPRTAKVPVSGKFDEHNYTQAKQMNTHTCTERKKAN